MHVRIYIHVHVGEGYVSFFYCKLVMGFSCDRNEIIIHCNYTCVGQERRGKWTSDRFQGQKHTHYGLIDRGEGVSFPLINEWSSLTIISSTNVRTIPI